MLLSNTTSFLPFGNLFSIQTTETTCPWLEEGCQKAIKMLKCYNNDHMPKHFHAHNVLFKVEGSGNWSKMVSYSFYESKIILNMHTIPLWCKTRRWARAKR